MKGHRINISFSGTSSTEDISSETEEDITPPPTRKIVKTKIVKQPTPHTTVDDINITLPTRICVLGVSQSGKSTLIRRLVKSLTQKNKNIVATWFFGSNCSEEVWIPKLFRQEKISKHKLNNIRALQQTREFRASHQIIILDDILLERLHNDKFWSDFISTSRHQRITIIFSCQYIKVLSPIMRDNIQRFFVCSSNNNSCDALHGLSSNADKYSFRASLSKARKGACLLFSTIPGEQELTTIKVDPLEPQDY